MLGLSRSVVRTLVRIFLPERGREFILGDLEEAYIRRLDAHGRWTANWRYLRDAVASTFATWFLPKAARPSAPDPGRPPRRTPLLLDLLADLREASRSLRRRPAFLLIAFSTLSLGIGTALAVFGLVDQVLLNPLPGVRAHGGAAYLEFYSAQDSERRSGIAVPEFESLRVAAGSIDGMAAYGSRSLHIRTDSDRPVEVRGQVVHGDFFEILGVIPSRGQLFTHADGSQDGGPFPAVISERLWASLFNRSEGALSSTIRVNGEPLRVVAVAGFGFRGPERHRHADVWLPRAALGASRNPQRIMDETLLVRPRRGVHLDAVASEIGQLLERIEGNPQAGPYLLDLRPRLFAGLHTIPSLRERTYLGLVILGSLAALVLLISCANVGNLLMIRILNRGSELAVRRSLGASSARIARQILMESLLLAILGGAVGLPVGWSLSLLFRRDSLAMGVENFGGLVLSTGMLAFVATVVLVTTLLIGGLSAWLGGRAKPGRAVRAGERPGAPTRGGARHAVSAVQVALCVPLLVGAILLGRTLRNLYSVDVGMSVDEVSALTLSPGGLRLSATELHELHRQLLDAARGVRGVEAAAIDLFGPFSDKLWGGARLPSSPAGDQLPVTLAYVTPGWFELLSVAPVTGRTFVEEDRTSGAHQRVVITEPLARKLFGRGDAVGEPLMAGLGLGAESEVVGVVGNLRLTGPEFDPDDVVFLLSDERPAALSLTSLLLRTTRFDAGLAEEVRRTVESVMPWLPVPLPVPLKHRIDAQLAEQRLFARLTALLSGLSVLLAVVGLYSFVAFELAGRRKELGIRLALGSGTLRTAATVSRHACAVVGTGMVLGLTGAFFASRLLESQLFGVERLDPASYAAAAALFGAATILACWAPVRSATRVDPAITLRED